MQTFFEILEQAAVQAGDISLSSAIKLNLDDEHLELLTKAADIYASQSNSHKQVVMQAKKSDGVSEGEQLPAEEVAQNGRVDLCLHTPMIKNGLRMCIHCLNYY